MFFLLFLDQLGFFCMFLTFVLDLCKQIGKVLSRNARWQEFPTMKVKVLVTQSCPTLCDPMDCNTPGSFVLGILQARVLEWVAIPFSRGSS